MGIPESRGWKKIEKKLREILGTLPKLLHCVVLALSTLSTGAYNSIMVMITVNGITNLNEDRKGVETTRTDGQTVQTPGDLGSSGEFYEIY